MKSYYATGIILSLMVIVMVILTLSGCANGGISKLQPDAGILVTSDGLHTRQSVDALDSSGNTLFSVESRQRMYILNDSTACVEGKILLGKDSTAPSVKIAPLCFDPRELWQMVQAAQGP